MTAHDGFLARLVDALAARPSTTTASYPLPARTRLAAALAARPVTRAGPSGAAGFDAARLHADAAQGDKLLDRVKAVLTGLLDTPPDQLRMDSDGNIGIRAGSAMIFVRAQEDPPLVDVFSPLLTGVQPSESLYRRLSEHTNDLPIGRVYCTGDTVWASVPVVGEDFQPSHLAMAVQDMHHLADDLDDRLRAEFGGKRFFDSAPAGLSAVPDPTNYLRRLAARGAGSARSVLVELLAERRRLGELRSLADGGDGHAATRLAGLLHADGQDVEAERWWRRAVDQGEPSARAELATLLAAQGRADDAVPVLRAALNDDDWSAAGPLLRLLTRQGRLDEVIDVLRGRRTRPA
ncbi:T3SS (YopN, CesT) and YbjN peptide-binding chaperone 1 [Micromonospora echinofusca]|uniref:TY-Chap central domain-containing protein n=1 Tax=Micromonospora echinofusca TaxID=47858 RepID=A0ABS3VYU8_MICEH|nr:hypothetical protein [Micromonospora echinofusca]MBO4209554.1 hypothetical protein [Micromonospora echinofusca]